MPPHCRHAKADRVVVTVPCDRDGVGGALRDIFARDRGLPDDMALLLAKLDRVNREF